MARPEAPLTADIKDRDQIQESVNLLIEPDLEADNGVRFVMRFTISGLARFQQVDPQEEYPNSYSYVGNKPVVAFDPNGEHTVITNGIGGNPVPGPWPGGSTPYSWSYVPNKVFLHATDFDPNGGDYTQSYIDGKDAQGNSRWTQVFIENAGYDVPRGGASGDIERFYNALKLATPGNRNGKTLNAVGHSGGGIIAVNAALRANKEGYHVDNVYTVASPIFSLGKHKLRRQGTNVRSFYIKSDPVSWVAAGLDFITGDWGNLFNKENWISTDRWLTKAHLDGVKPAADIIKADITQKEKKLP